MEFNNEMNLLRARIPTPGLTSFKPRLRDEWFRKEPLLFRDAYAAIFHASGGDSAVNPAASDSTSIGDEDWPQNQMGEIEYSGPEAPSAADSPETTPASFPSPNVTSSSQGLT